MNSDLDVAFYKANEKDIDFDIYNRTYNISIAKHTVIDEKNPFILYAVEIKSNFSKYAVLK